MNYECCSLETIGNSIGKLESLGLITCEDSIKRRNYHDPEGNHYFINPVGKTALELKNLFERMTFFKPIVTLSSGIFKLEEDVKRILNQKGTHKSHIIGKL